MARVLSSTRFRLWSGVVVAVAMALVPMSQVGRVAAQQAGPAMSANVTVIATGLNNPRGLRWGPDGNLYVAEGGRGGSRSTQGLSTSPAGPCQQVVPPVGPYTGDYTARISRIDSKGVRTTVADGLPSSQTSPALGSLVSGVADVEFVKTGLYALLGGAGCSHAIADVPNGIAQISPDGTWSLYDLSAFLRAHPVAKPEPDDFEPDGTWYSMVQAKGDLYAVEPNHGELDKLSLSSGQVSRVVDISASQGHIMPTSLAYGPDGNFYVANLGTFPIVPGSEKVFQITPSGQISVYATGLTAVTGLTFDSKGQLYALETSTVAGQTPTPGNGMVVRVSASGPQTVATGLTVPTGITAGPDGNLYVSNIGFGAPPGAGQIVKINPNASM